jgi:6-phosphofructokinase 1
MKRIGVLTSGGDAPGMNCAIRAVVRTAIYHGLEVMGIERGYAGLIDGVAWQMGARSVGGIMNRGGTILRSARSEEFMTPEGRDSAAQNVKRFLIEGLVVIGGDGTYRGAMKLADEHAVSCVGVPGTIDNDIGGTDYTIGFDTAINTALDAIDKIRDTAASHDRLFVVEVMGRGVGFIALSVGVAGGAEEILCPETASDIDAMCARLELGRKAGKTSSIVIVAEGDETGGAVRVGERIKEKTHFTDVRVCVLGHLQRGGAPTAYDRIMASRFGSEAVMALIRGEKNVMVAAEKGEVMTRPMSDSWTLKRELNPHLLELAKKLVV